MINDIYKYLDYRQYLSDTYQIMKEKDPTFSYRNFAKMAGSTSPNFLQLVRDRKLNIKEGAVRLLSQHLNLRKKEERYFQHLVDFDQAKTYTEKDQHFRQIIKNREYSDIQTLTKEKYEFLAQWYIAAIFELITHPEFTPEDPIQWVMKRIEPPISENKVRNTIKLLENLELVKKQENGYFVRTNKSATIPNEVSSVAITNFHIQTNELAKESFDKFDPDETHIHSITVGLTEQELGEVKDRIDAFWKELLDQYGNEKHSDRIYHINLHTFPLSKKL